MRVRRAKLDRLRREGVDPYPVGYPRTATAAELRERFGQLAADAQTGVAAGVAGRVMLNRPAGRLVFATLRDGTGDLQVMLAEDRVGPAALAAWRERVDLGDHVGVTGEVVTTRRGELTVAASQWALTAKALRPLPDKHAGLRDPESRVRQRYLDLLVNPRSRELLMLRGAVLASLRGSLHARGFLEVETPVLQTVHGGANARPFATRSNAYDIPLYLRIALELYLKRLVVGGIERVYELGRNFRNEGVDATHNPEFSMLEAYQAYADYRDIGRLTREIIQQAAVAATGSTVVRHADGSEHELGGEWPWVGVHEAVAAALGEPLDPATPLARCRRLAERAGVAVPAAANRGQVVLELYEQLVEGATVTPTFYRDFPTEVSPLTRAHRSVPGLAERWDLVAFGTEIGTGYSELVDPLEQRARLTEQAAQAAGGDPEAMVLDEDFLRALEHGMPPTGGVGVGVDRILLMLTGASFRELITFPLVRPGG